MGEGMSQQSAVVKPWGCHSKPREDGYMVRDGCINKGGVLIQLTRYHKDTATIECQYRKSSPTDPRCHGCTSP
jgi:hypothetical protein